MSAEKFCLRHGEVLSVVILLRAGKSLRLSSLHAFPPEKRDKLRIECKREAVKASDFLTEQRVKKGRLDGKYLAFGGIKRWSREMPSRCLAVIIFTRIVWV
jgi:hypothetical protein